MNAFSVRLAMFLSAVLAINAFAQSPWTIGSTGLKYISSVKAVNSSVAYVAGTRGIMKTTDGGSTWVSAGGTAVDTIYWNTIETVGPDTVFATATIGSGDVIFRTVNGGGNWVPVASQPNGFFNGVRMFDHLNGFAVSDPVAGAWVILLTSDGGASWHPTASPPLRVGTETGFSNSAAIAGQSFAWFGTGNHRIYHSTDGGVRWDSISTGNDDCYAIWFADPAHGIMGTGNGIAYSTDAGATWSAVSLGMEVYGVTWTISSGFWAAGGKTVTRSTDGGVTWKTSLSTSFYIQHLSFTEDGGALYGLAGGDSGKVAIYNGLLDGAPDSKAGRPTDYRVFQNYPNPFNPSTTIRYDLPHASRVSLKVYNTLGQEVATLVNDTKAAGVYTVQFDAGRLASGVYFYRLQAGNFVETKKLVVLR
jgi:photosystem II stability/assembly factor-like uncharacterized protein